jgi:hypothetical protein
VNRNSVGLSLISAATALVLTPIVPSASIARATTDCSSPECTAKRAMDFDDDHPLVGLQGVIHSANPALDLTGSVSESVSLVDTNTVVPFHGPIQFLFVFTLKNPSDDRPRLGLGCARVSPGGGVGSLLISYTNYGPARAENRYRFLYDSYRGVWDYWVNGIWGSCSGTQSYANAVWIGGTTYWQAPYTPAVMGITHYVGTRYRRDPGACGSLSYPCAGWWVPTDTTPDVPHGPPPDPRLYYSKWWATPGAPLIFENYSECHRANNCPSP